MSVPGQGRIRHRGPVHPGDSARTALRPAAHARITGGLWDARRRTNAEVSLNQGPDLLEKAGNLHNLRLAAGTVTGDYKGDLPFLDTDVYKWLEAAAWQLGDPATAGTPLAARLTEDIERMTALIADAQQDDGYLNSWFQAARPGQRFTDLRWGHELYCAGHLIQAAVALHRTTGRTGLLDTARRFADLIDATFGPAPDKAIDGICGHAEIETALVELYRETGVRRYLDLAGYFIDRHGHGLLNAGDRHGIGPGPAYCQDHVPLRKAETVSGHAVRQLYLLAGATDVAAETGERALRAATERLWEAMTTTKTYITGGLGARHQWEDFGDPYELPSERAYSETCAAIASIQWSWRLALLTGEARYSDLIERTLFNGFLAGISLDGTRWLYVNPLQVRDGYAHQGGDQGARRTPWFRCACCPPNVMRLLASLPSYMASSDGEGIQIHQYAEGSWTAEIGDREVTLGVVTDYPWDGHIRVTVEDCGPGNWTLSLRVPQWCAGHAARIAGEASEATVRDGWLRLRRRWSPGDVVELDLAMDARLTRADSRVDAVRGCVAIERGPLVYCLEQADQPGVAGLDDVVLDQAAGLSAQYHPGLLGGITAVTAAGLLRPRPQAPGWWPYRSAPAGDGSPAGEPITLTAVPYFAWANREDGSMRVWLPAR